MRRVQGWYRDSNWLPTAVQVAGEKYHPNLARYNVTRHISSFQTSKLAQFSANEGAKEAELSPKTDGLLECNSPRERERERERERGEACSGS